MGVLLDPKERKPAIPGEMNWLSNRIDEEFDGVKITVFKIDARMIERRRISGVE